MVGKRLFAFVMLGTDWLLPNAVCKGRWSSGGWRRQVKRQWVTSSSFRNCLSNKSAEFIHSFENNSSLKFNKDSYFVQWKSTLQNNFSFPHALYCPYIYNSLYKIGTTYLCQLSLKQQQYKSCLWRMCWPWTVSEYFTSKTSADTGEALLD